MTNIEAVLSRHQVPKAPRALQISLMCVMEARPCVLAIFLLRFALGVAMTAVIVDHGQLARACVAALIWELGVFSTYLFNGVMDVQEDRTNGSRRPIARGALPTGIAAWVAATAAALSLVGGFVLGREIAWAVVMLLLLGYLYSGPPAYLKRQPFGTAVTVVAMGLLTFYAGSAAYAGPSGFYGGIALPIFAGAMSLWLGLVGMPTKDLSDVAGDRAAGRRSIAIVYGESVAWRVPAVTACGLAVAFCVAGTFLAPSLIWPAAVMLGGALMIAAVCLSRLSRGCRRRRRRPYRVFMATQFLVHFSALPGLWTYL